MESRRREVRSSLASWGSSVDPTAVIDAVTRQQQRLKSPPVPMLDLLSLFERLGLIETVAVLRRLLA
jgi:hypothetical protein